MSHSVCPAGPTGSQASRSAFTLVELLVVIAIVGMLIALLLPAVQAARESARRNTCSNNLKQLGIGLHGYHDATGSFPFGQGGTNTGNPSTGNNYRVSGFIPLLPYIEQAPIYDRIRTGGNGYPPYGPDGLYSWANWNYTLPVLICPSDPAEPPSGSGGAGTSQSAGPGASGQNNYAFSRGDSIYNIRTSQNTRGMFMYLRTVRLADVLDGASNTLAMSERSRASFPLGGNPRAAIKQGTAVGLVNLSTNPATNPAACLATANGPWYSNPSNVKGVFGTIWTCGDPERTGFTTVLPPNAPSCEGTDYGTSAVPTNGPGSGVFPPNSYHPDGVLGLMGDGSVRFINEQIDTGNLAGSEAIGGPSVFGVWGAMGSRAGGEATSNEATAALQ